MSTAQGNESTVTRLKRDSIRIIMFDFVARPEVLAHYNSVLTDDDKTRLDQIRNSVRQTELLISRAVMRLTLSGLINVPPSNIPIFTNAYGKPYCDSQHNIKFNLSHSGSYGLLAINTDQEIGIDIQQHRTQKNVCGLAQRFFANSEILLLEQLQKNDCDSTLNNTFYQIWARKEALLKATGTGLAQGLSAYPVIDSSDRDSKSISVALDNSRYIIRDIPSPDNYSAALATENNDSAFEIHQWQHSS